MRSEKELKRDICRLFRLRETAELRLDYRSANTYLFRIYQLESMLGDKPDGSWSAYQRYLLAT